MRDYRVTKLTEAVMKQTKKNPTESRKIALNIYEATSWPTKKSFTQIVKDYLG